MAMLFNLLGKQFFPFKDVEGNEEICNLLEQNLSGKLWGVMFDFSNDPSVYTIDTDEMEGAAIAVNTIRMNANREGVSYEEYVSRLCEDSKTFTARLLEYDIILG